MVAPVEIPLLKARRRYGHDRVDRLVNQWEGRIRTRFRKMVARILGDAPMRKLEKLIAEGRVEEAIKIAERASVQLATETAGAFIASGEDVAAFIDEATGIFFNFDQANPRAVTWIQNNRLRLIREFSDTQRGAVRQAIRQGILDGANPRQQARAFRESIGLTERQVKAVNNFRKLLERRSSEALTRKLRDRRFDGTVRGSIRSGSPLTRDQIDRMVSRYHERYLKYRSETIARTEALEAVHAGNEESFQQAVDTGDIQAEQLQRTWNTAKDERVRGSHRAMHRQQRSFGEPFKSGKGNELRYPGDPQAPAEDRVQCRCSVGTEMALAP